MFIQTVRHNQSGLTLVEVLVALAILAAVAVIFLLGLSTASRATVVSQERVTADSLAKSQMEYVKSSPYDDVNNPPLYGIDPNLLIPEGYGVSVTAEHLDPDNDGTDDDDGLQKITVTITRNGETIFTLESYKVNR